MNRKARRFFVATALGTMLGLYASIAFLPELVWWFGALMGGVSAGFVYALPDIIRYSPLAFGNAKNELRKTGEIFSTVSKSIREAPASKQWNRLVFITFLIIFFAWACFFLLIGTEQLWFTIGLLIVLLYILPSVATVMWSVSLSESKASETEKIKRAKKAIFFITPPGYLFLLMLGLVRFGPRMIKSTALFLLTISAEFGRFLATFAKTLFFLVHSKELVLCMIDAGFGVLIAYLLLATTETLNIGPGLLFGGLIGGLLGVLHYEIVSVRILRVA